MSEVELLTPHNPQSIAGWPKKQPTKYVILPFPITETLHIHHKGKHNIEKCMEKK